MDAIKHSHLIVPRCKGYLFLLDGIQLVIKGTEARHLLTDRVARIEDLPIIIMCYLILDNGFGHTF
jgi:hypothetical protein